jgi:hypothetical protein
VDDDFDDGFDQRTQALGGLRYRLCPRCARAVPATSSERYCINDGAWLLERCPLCGSSIVSPYARFCAGCGLEFAAYREPDAQERGT